jgi:hypothetical protein
MGNMNDNLDGEHLWKPDYTRRAFIVTGVACGAAYFGQPLMRKFLQWYVGGIRNEYDWDLIAAPLSADYKKLNMDKSSVGLTLSQLTDASSRPEFEKGLADPEAMRSLIFKIKDGKLGKLESIVVQGDYLGFRITTKEPKYQTNFYYARIKPELKQSLTN